MSWSTAVHRIPHVYEHIFGYLDGRDGLAAAEACPNWESAIFSSQSIRNQLALKIFLEPQDSNHVSLSDMLACLGISMSRDKRMITVEDVNRSCRRFDSVIVSPGPDHTVVLEDLLSLLKTLNQRQPIHWVRIDGTNGDSDQLTKPKALMEMGRIFTELKHLELILPKTSLWDYDWMPVFQKFSLLESLILHNGHVLAMDSVRRHCRQLKRVELFNFTLPNPKCVKVFVSQVNTLMVDGQFVIDR